MTPYLPGPHSLDIPYSVQTREHVMRLNCSLSGNPGANEDWEDYAFHGKGGIVGNVSEWVATFVPLLLPFFSDTDADIHRAELWEYSLDGFTRTFLQATTLGLAGTSGGSTVPASQAIWTFRSTVKNTARLVLMETTTPAGPKYAPGGLPGSWEDVAVELTAAGSLAMARDNGYFGTLLGAFPGQNERLFKRIYR